MKLFNLRDYILDEFINQSSEEIFIKISKPDASKFRNKVAKLRISIRREIGVEDLQVTKEVSNDNE